MSQLLGIVSPRFSPPVCYQLSLAVGFSLLRTHLHTAPLIPSLAFPLVRSYLLAGDGTALPRLSMLALN